ncbi:hypothetical protein FQZ97_727490 [compost metagenome]
MFVVQAQRAGQGSASLARMGQARRTRARVGVAGIDHQRTNTLPRRQVLTAHLHRGGGVTVLGEHRANRTTLVQQKDREILAIGLANACLSHTDAHAPDGEQVRGRRRVELNGHVNSVYSG